MTEEFANAIGNHIAKKKYQINMYTLNLQIICQLCLNKNKF